jgi:hypothetical protein
MTITKTEYFSQNVSINSFLSNSGADNSLHSSSNNYKHLVINQS